MGSCHTLDQLDSCLTTPMRCQCGPAAGGHTGRAAGHRAGRRCADRPGRAAWHRPGRKLLTLVTRCWRVGTASATPTCCAVAPPARCWAIGVMAPSTLGTFLRSFTFGHVRQLDRLTEQLRTRAWAAGAGPGDGPMTMDLDSTVCEVHGDHKQGAAYGSTHALGYHPLVASAPRAARSCTPASGPVGPTRPADGPVRRRTGRPGAPLGRQRRADHARRFGVLVGQDHPGLPPPPAPLLYHRPPDHADPRRGRHHP
jgi:hypothetical protein